MAGWAELPAELIMAVIESEPLELLPLHRLRRLAGVCKHWRNTIVRRVSLGPFIVHVLYAQNGRDYRVCGEDYEAESLEQRTRGLWRGAMMRLRFLVKQRLRAPMHFGLPHLYVSEDDNNCGSSCPGCGGAYRGDATDNCGHPQCWGPCPACEISSDSPADWNAVGSQRESEKMIRELNNAALESWLAKNGYESLSRQIDRYFEGTKQRDAFFRAVGPFGLVALPCLIKKHQASNRPIGPVHGTICTGFAGAPQGLAYRR
jgi:hypothetical protein